MRQTTSFFLALAATLFFSSPALAQDPDALLSQLSDKAQTYKAYEIAYTSTLVDLKNDFELTQDGTVQIEGDRFLLNLGDYIIYCDGETVWFLERPVAEATRLWPAPQPPLTCAQIVRSST